MPELHTRAMYKMDKMLTLFGLAAIVMMVRNIFALPVCGPDNFWMESTGTCEPCGILCDPPAIYERDCPALCPDYHPPTATPSTTHKAETRIHIALYIAAAVTGFILLPVLIYLLKKFWRRIKVYFDQMICQKFAPNFPIQEQGDLPESNALVPSPGATTPFPESTDDGTHHDDGHR